jgi:hypothetical protein
MLRLVLESHSLISCEDEPTCYEILSDKEKINEFLLQEKSKKWQGFKIPRFAEQLDYTEIFDYGTPNVSHPFPNFYENEPLIFMIRDVRDVVCSMMELKAGKNSWIETWGIPIVKYQIENLKGFNERFSSEISLLKESEFSPYATAAFFWKYKNESYFKYLDLGFPMVKIFYEKFVEKPTPYLKSILNLLELNWEDSLLQHHLLEHSQVDKRGMAIGNTDSTRKISDFHKARYKEELTQDQINEILLISGDTMKSFGYAIN